MSLCVLRDGLVKQKKKTHSGGAQGRRRAHAHSSMRLNKEAILYQQHTISAHIKFE